MNVSEDEREEAALNHLPTGGNLTIFMVGWKTYIGKKAGKLKSLIAALCGWNLKI